MSETEAALVALGLVAVLAALHVASPHLRRVSGVSEPALASFAGGLAVAYVFVHLLPELAEGNEHVAEVLDDVVERSALLDLAIFVVALAGFAAFYALDRLARRKRGGPRHGGEEAEVGTFATHLGAFAVLNAVIAYTMPLRVRTDLGFAALFTLAIALHYVLTDRALSEHYPSRFDHRGRALLVAALLLGWGAAVVAAPVSTLVVSVLTAVVAGSVLLNVFSEELPQPGRSRLGWFLAGAAIYAALLAGATALQDEAPGEQDPEEEGAEPAEPAEGATHGEGRP